MKSVPDGKFSSGKSQQPGLEHDGVTAWGETGFNLQFQLNSCCSLFRASLSAAVTWVDTACLLQWPRDCLKEGRSGAWLEPVQCKCPSRVKSDDCYSDGILGCPVSSLRYGALVRMSVRGVCVHGVGRG